MIPSDGGSGAIIGELLQLLGPSWYILKRLRGFSVWMGQCRYVPQDTMMSIDEDEREDLQRHNNVR